MFLCFLFYNMIESLCWQRYLFFVILSLCGRALVRTLMVRWNTMDRKVKLALAAAHMIKPGMGATLAGFILSSLLKIIGPRKSVARKNIELVYPGIPNSERDKLVAESYDNMVWTFLRFTALRKRFLTGLRRWRARNILTALLKKDAALSASLPILVIGSLVPPG